MAQTDVCVWHYDIMTGNCIIAADPYGVKLVCFDISGAIMGMRNTNKYTEHCADELEEYFAGKRQKFKVLINPDGTDLQKKIWEGIRAIPFAKTKLPEELAAELSEEHGETITAKDVEDAVKKNKLSIVIPEHRVVNDKGFPLGFGRTRHRREGLLKFELQLAGKTPPAYMKRWRLDL